MKILVTGATGFIGGFLLRYLAKEFPEAEIVGTGRNEEKSRQIESEGFRMIRGDITDLEFVKNSFSGITHVVHSAGKITMWGKYRDFYRDNVSSTRYLINELPDIQRFIYISTANVYFNGKDRLNVREDDPLSTKHVSYYPVTKYLAEQEALNNSRGIHSIALRPRGVIGPGDTTSMPRIMKAYIDNKIKIVGDGKNVIDFSSVKNLAHAVSLSVKAHDSLAGQAFNITDGSTHKFWPLLKEATKKLGVEREIGKVNYSIVYAYAAISELIAKITGSDEPAHLRYSAAVMKVSFTLNIDKARSMLGYKPLITTEECVSDYIDWAKETGQI